MTLVPRCSVAIVTRVLVVALVWGAVPTGAVALLGTAARAQEGQGGQEAQEAEPQVEVQVIDADDTMVVGVRVIDAEGDVEVVQIGRAHV